MTGKFCKTATGPVNIGFCMLRKSGAKMNDNGRVAALEPLLAALRKPLAKVRVCLMNLAAPIQTNPLCGPRRSARLERFRNDVLGDHAREVFWRRFYLAEPACDF
jgi:hypothetical protein